MGLNFRRILQGIQIVPKTTSTASLAGEIDFDTTSNKLNLNNGTITDHVVTEADTATLTNKTLAVGSNSITGTTNTAAEFNVSTGNLESSITTATELGYVHGVTSSIQTQLNSISGSAITSLTGDVTATGPGASAATLATVNGNVGSFGSSTSIPNFTVNAKGLITAAGSNVVVAPAGTLTGTTLASNVVSSSLTSVGTITSGAWTGTTIAIANGGTGQTTASAAFNALNPMTTTGDLIYESATNVASRLPIGTAGQLLTVVGGVPTWQSGSGSANPINLTQISTPSTPSSGSNDIYFKTASSVNFSNSTSATGFLNAITNSNYIGQSFVPPISGTATSATLHLKYSSGSAMTGTLFASLYTDSGGNPGTLLQSSSTINANTVTTSAAPFVFSFSGQSLTIGTKYHVVLNTSGVTSFGGSILGAAQGSNVYGSGNSETSSDGGTTWTQFTSSDLQFSIDGTFPANNALTTLDSTGLELPVLSTGLVVAGHVANFGSEWTVTSSTLSAFNSNSSATPNILDVATPYFGIAQTSNNQLPQITINNLVPGIYKVTANFTTDFGTPTTVLTYAINDGTTTSGIQVFLDAGNVGYGANIHGIFSYSSTGNVTFSIFGAATSGAVLINLTTAPYAQLNWIVEKIG